MHGLIKPKKLKASLNKEREGKKGIIILTQKTQNLMTEITNFDLVKIKRERYIRHVKP
jgi:hypothetical protein